MLFRSEITTRAKVDFVKTAREAIREIGYVNDDDVFHADKVFVNVIVTQQSPDIAQGVDARAAKGKNPQPAKISFTMPMKRPWLFIT